MTEGSAGVYWEPNKSKTTKRGYAEGGAKIPVQATPVSKTGCAGGWYALVAGGYICGDDGTINPKDERARHRPKQPNLSNVLPYVYARNTQNGTPMYRTVPTRDQVKFYEPYLTKKEEKPKDAPAPTPAEPAIDDATRKAKEEQRRRHEDMQRAMLGDDAARKLAEEAKRERQTAPVNAPGAPAAEADADAGTPEWWQQDKPELGGKTLQELNGEGDDVIIGRMVKGFYIAVQQQFNWGGRVWYRSTRGHVAPADRFVQAAGPEFHGVELSDTLKLPIAWAYGSSKTQPRYNVDAEKKSAKSSGSVARLQPISLTGKELQVGKATYLETVDGTWVKQSDVRVTKPGAPPADIGPDEVWIDVNLSTQSLVLFRGTQPLYATLISSGKESTDKEKDHKSPLGEFRIQDKHITATMDGDGTAAGDLPYSIEAVPYVMYFHRSYALHGAFWHGNFGVRMSHGCVNLAPLDAKYLFFHSDPAVPEGMAGAVSSTDRPGSRVVVHE